MRPASTGSAVMSTITALFWDVGGVLLTNGWDGASRRKLVEKFHLDGEDFEARHDLVSSAFETGQLTLSDYWGRTIFYRPHDFTAQAVQDFMFAQSHPYPETLALVERLARTRKYLLATLNNESSELNRYRIEQFGLRNYFTLFLSSCFLGIRKPDPLIYRLALDITQRPSEECVFIDDRRLNVECARREGMHAIQFQNPIQLQAEFGNLGIEL
jgi:putative hydrolase of the HAD superfamily